MEAILTLGILGAVFGLGLAYAAELLKVEVDVRVEKVLELLPGYNCGACGYPGCSGFAEGIIDGKVEKLSDCKPGKDENYDPILAYLADNPAADGTISKVKK